MSGPCSDAFERLAREMGDFSCSGANPVLNVHDPFGLSNATLPVIELAMIVGAALSLRHALRRRRAGDPAGLAIWLGALVYLIIVEPPLYFPDSFGLEDQLGLIFVHNEFTVQFLWDRLPLYIVAVYPAMTYLAYELVRSVGVFERRGPFVSAICVGFVHQCFYETFDHLGPQLRWWIWNPDAETNRPMLGSVPVSSMVIFSAIGPFAVTFLVRTLIARRIETAGPLPAHTFAARVVAVGALIPLFLFLGSVPASAFGLGDEPNHTAQAITYSIELAAIGITATIAIVQSWRHASQRDRDSAADRYVLTHGAIYLCAIGGLWIAALPDYANAHRGLTDDGTPIGSLPYALACFAASILFLTLVAARRQSPQHDASLSEPQLTPNSKGGHLER